MKNIDFKYLVDNLYEPIYTVDLNRKIIYWNKAAEKITGYTTEEVKGSSCSENILEHIDEQGNSLCEGKCPLAATMEDGCFREARVYFKHKSGNRVPVEVKTVPLRDKNGNIIGGGELFVDITANKAFEDKLEQMKKLAYFDELTGIPRRSHINLELENKISELKRQKLEFALLFLDIDNFKIFNDTYGHSVGDLVLKNISKTLRSNIRPFDFVGRWGGEEFIIILNNVNKKSLKEAGERYRNLIERTEVDLDDGKRLNTTASFGGTLANEDDSPQSLVKRADDLMYESKEKGKNMLTID